MANIPVYDLQGSVTREVEVDPDLFDSEVRQALIKEAHIAWRASQRQGTHSTKNRSAVAGGGRKPWKQKGTGRARQGTTRAPQWVGGGRAHGPSPRDYSYRLPRKQRRLALRSVIRLYLERGTIKAVEGLDGLDKPSTKTVAGFLGKIGLAGKGATLVSEGSDKSLVLSARNLQKVDVAARAELNAGQLLQRPNLILTAGALDALVQEAGK